MVNVPITALVTLFGSISMAAAWYIVGQRMHHSPVPSVKQVKLFRSFFGFMAIFAAIITVPYLWLITDPSGFGLAAGIAYTVGHLATYVAMIYLARMTCTIIPGLTKWEWPITALLTVLALIATYLTGISVIVSSHPTYTPATKVTDWHASPAVAGVIALIAVIGLFTPMILFFVSAAKAHGPRRLRSFLLGLGLLSIAVGGPLNDNSHTFGPILLANILAIFGQFMLATGVVYQINEEAIVATHAKPVTASSNTV